MRHQRITILSVLLAIAAIAGVSEAPAYGQDAEGCAWTQIGNTTSTYEMSFRAGAIESPNRLWAVGETQDEDGGAAIRAWDGSSWQEESSPQLLWTHLNDVDVTAGSGPIAVGSYVKRGEEGQQRRRPLALHRKPDEIVGAVPGTQWERLTLPTSGLKHEWLSAVNVVDADQAWAVGEAYEGRDRTRVLIYRWNGETWRLSPPRLNGLFWDVGASAPDDVWAVGTTRNRDGVGRTLAFHFNGSKWRRVLTPNHNRLRFHTLLGVGVRSKTRAWAVGYRETRIGTSVPIALRWNGVSWRLSKNLPTTSRIDGATLNDVVPLDGEVIGVGSNGSTLNPRPLLWRRTTGGWTWIDAPENENGHMDDIKVGTDGSLLAVGGGVFAPGPDEHVAQDREYILFRPPC